VVPSDQRTSARNDPAIEARDAGSSDALGRVLVVDDDESMCEIIELGLSHRGFDVSWRSHPSAAIELVTREDFDAVVTDLRMDEMHGLELCQRVSSLRPGLPVVVVTGRGGAESVISAMRAGAYDYITKPVDIGMLDVALRKAVKHYRLECEVRRLRHAAGEHDTGEGIVGESHAVRKLRGLIGRVAESDASVLITGESGTGKELVARDLHHRSARFRGPFIAINCAAVPAALLESELFGHVRGAFTDARTSRTGLFVEANGGTLFLDEVGELPLEMQPKLLRALQERSVRPVGGSGEVRFDARIVASTNRNLPDEVQRSRFRQDLYYRLNVVRLDVPPLRERGSDILLLAQHFVRRCAEGSGKVVRGFSTSAASRLLTYPWPGNVRELENCVERAVTLTLFDTIMLDDLPETVLASARQAPIRTPDHVDELIPLAEVDRQYILRVLALVGGNKSRAAAILGLDRRTLYRKLKRFNGGQP